jgi:uncharacterized protein YcgI (DUF1989 family)
MGEACPPANLKAITLEMGKVFYIIDPEGYSVRDYKGMDCAFMIAANNSDEQE